MQWKSRKEMLTSEFRRKS